MKKILRHSWKEGDSQCPECGKIGEAEWVNDWCVPHYEGWQFTCPECKCIWIVTEEK
jgi:hypothetical protein